ncbi:MAG: hypothetical protein LBU36_07875 [Clostridiales bacterium]|jgi:hypothetical protein|nr:hypothetical protein [Clostridiales bacterium]
MTDLMEALPQENDFNEIGFMDIAGYVAVGWHSGTWGWDQIGEGARATRRRWGKSRFDAELLKIVKNPTESEKEHMTVVYMISD